LADVRARLPTPEAALVQAATLRLAVHGARVPRPDGESAELLLYERLEADFPDRASCYARYNALLAELVSFLDALDRRRLRGLPTQLDEVG